MAKNTGVITNDCAMAGIKPAMLELPYPLIQVRCRNRDYAELLKVDYCGAVSELSAITQYINNQNRMACEKCSFAKMILAIAMAENGGLGVIHKNVSDAFREYQKDALCGNRI